MRYLPAFLALLPLAACQSPAQRQASDDAYCRSIGATGNMYAQCMMQRDTARRQDRASQSAALMALSGQMMTAAQPRPTTTTTCSRVGGYVVCNTN